ncbi:MAG: hypothetical protein AABZ10_13025 [Nitrospirota bacterium]
MESLRLHAQGEAFTAEKLSLRETIKVLDTTRMLLDTGLVIATARERLSADLRDSVNYDVQLRTGSIDAYISLSDVVKDVLPLLTPVAADFANQMEIILSKIKHAKVIIEWLGKKRNEGKRVEVKINVENSPGAVVLVSSDGDIHNTTQVDLNGALRLFQPLKDMSALCDGRRVKSIDYYRMKGGKKVEKAISMDPSSKQLYKAETLIENLTIKIIGSIFDLNTKSGKGKIELSDKTSYNIRVAKTVDIHKFSTIAYDKGPIECTVKPIMKLINGVPTLSGYEIVDYTPPAQTHFKMS